MKQDQAQKQHRIGPETDRLLHRAFTVDDAEAVFALNGNPDVMRWTCEPMLTSVEAARQAIASHTDFETYGYGRWACVLKQTQTVIGFCGLKYLADLNIVDVGYRFLPQYWGQGLATEACIASLSYGFEHLQLKEIYGLVIPDNVASVRVLEKSGLQSLGEFDYENMTILRYVKRSPQQSQESIVA